MSTKEITVLMVEPGKHPMVLGCLFNSLRLDTNIPLCGCGAAVLQEPLYQSHIIIVISIKLPSILLAETVRVNISS